MLIPALLYCGLFFNYFAYTLSVVGIDCKYTIKKKNNFASSKYSIGLTI